MNRVLILILCLWISSIGATVRVGSAGYSSGQAQTATGWTKSGTNVYTTTMSDNVGIGTNTPQGGFVVTNGNVGIGTWAPSSPFQINGASAMFARDTQFVFNFENTAQSTFTSALMNYGNAGFLFQPNGVEKSRFDIGGNLGIGTTLTTAAGLSVMRGNVGIGTWAPAAGLEIVSSVNYPAFTFTAKNTLTTQISIGRFSNGNNEGLHIWHLGSNGGATFAAPNNTVLLSADYTGSGSYRPFALATGGGARLLIDTAGNVGIGTTTPMGGLAIMNGNVGIGTWVAGANLDTRGDIRVFNGVYLSKQTTAPSIANNDCGSLTQGVMITSPSSTDEAGAVTTGTSAGATAACKITFGQTHTSAPAWCACDDNTTPLVLQPTYTNLAVTCTAPATLAASTVSYACKWTDK